MGNSNNNNNKIRKKENPAQPPIEFICPITCELMIDPVITRSGQTYERKAIEHWLCNQGHDTDPLSNVILKDKSLVCNYVLKSMIQEWMEKNKIKNKVTNNNEKEIKPKNFFKIVVIGNDQVEKYKFVKHYVPHVFDNDDDLRSTSTVFFKKKNKKKIKLEIIWNCTNFLPNLYFRNIDGIIILCDENKYESIYDIEKYFEKAKNHVPNTKKIIVSLICKKDYINNKENNERKTIISIANQLKLEYFFIDLQNKHSIKKPFDQLLKQFVISS